MAHVEKDEIDFNKLERDMLAALEADEKYTRENDAKFRAVHQKVATYEEFKDIVAASHLKPLDKKESLTEIKGYSWSSQAKSVDNNYSSSTTEATLKTTSAVPQNCIEFSKNWRRIGNSEDTKYSYLVELGSARLQTVFRGEISSAVLSEIILVLYNCLKTEHAQEVILMLLAFTTANRFSLCVDFMSKKEKEILKGLVDKCQAGNEEDIAAVRQNYKL